MQINPFPIWEADILPSEGICAGKNSVAAYLTENHGFTRLHLLGDTHELEKPDVLPVDDVDRIKERTFNNVQSLLDFVTKQWKQLWVTTDIWNEEVLENLLRRPSFILVSVDAPMSLRWKRFKER